MGTELVKKFIQKFQKFVPQYPFRGSEQTQAILSAPPGADFVPGSRGEECITGPDGVEECRIIEENYYDDSMEQPPIDVFDQYLEILEEEYEDALQRDTKGETEPFS